MNPTPVPAPAERVEADMVGSPWREEHEARYLFAVSRISGGRVLDLACGTGYGSVLFLEMTGAEVVAADASDEAIESTNIRVGRFGSRADVRREDATKLTFQDESFDTIVSFETIEHIPDDEAYVSELARVLKTGGQLILSTPNALITNPNGGKPENRFHVREYTPQDLRTLLETSLRVVESLGQGLSKESGVAPFLPSFRRDRLGTRERIQFLCWRLLLRIPPIRDKTYRFLTGCEFFPRRESYTFREQDLLTSHVQLLVCTKV